MSKELRYGLYALGAAICVAVLVFILWNFDPFGRRKNAESRAATATQSSTQATAATQSIDRYHTETIVIRDKVDQGVQNVQALPDAPTQLSPERRAALCAAIGRVRNVADPCEPTGAAQLAPGL